jgi:hypothetical protein
MSGNVNRARKPKTDEQDKEGLTREEFEEALRKASRPIPQPEKKRPKESDQASS